MAMVGHSAAHVPQPEHAASVTTAAVFAFASTLMAL
jgi:hypothetical protein